MSFSRLGRLSSVRCSMSTWPALVVSAARPRSNGVSTASASTYMRALDSYWFGIVNTAAQPTAHTSQVNSTACQR